MKLREISDWCLDRVIETTLFEMAHDRKVVISTVRGLANPIIDHLLYIILYSNSTAINHWKKELNSFILRLNRLSLKPSGKKKLSGDTYYDLLFNEPLEGDIIQLDRILKYIIEKEGTPTIDINKFQIKERLEKILHTISYDLSNDKFTDINDYI